MEASSLDHSRLSSGSCWFEKFGPKAALACLIPSAGYFLGKSCVTIDTQWHTSLKRQPCIPQGVFPVVWMGAYATIGAASFLVWKTGGGFSGAAHLPLMVYGGHLLTNWAWTPIFHGTKRIDYALYDCLALDATGALTAYLFYKIDQRAGLLLLPYLVWLAIETAANIYLYKKNPRYSGGAEIKDL